MKAAALLDAFFEAAMAPEEYRGEHGAPCKETGAPLHDLCVDGTYPSDVYTHPHYYTCGDPDEERAFSWAARFKGRPNAPVTVYRAVPKTVKDKHINPGDWVTVERKYAVEHGKSNLRNEYRIIKLTAHARDLFTEGNSLQEWGYDPQPEDQDARKQTRIRRYEDWTRRLEAGEKIAGINRFEGEVFHGRDQEALSHYRQELARLSA